MPQIGSPSTFTAPLLGLSCPVISFMKVDLPAPFGPSSPVMPGGTLDGDVVQADDLPVPLRDVLGGDDRRAHVTTSTPRTRRSSTEIDSAISPRITMSETCQGVRVARREPEDDVDDLRQVGAERQPRQRCCRR